MKEHQTYINATTPAKIKSEWRWYYDGLHWPVLYKVPVTAVVADDCKITLEVGRNKND